MPSLRVLLKKLLISIGIWNLPPLLYASNQFVLARLRGDETNFLMWYGFQAGGFVGWIPLTAVVFWLGARFRIDRGPRLRNIALHIIFGALAVLANTALAVLIFQITGMMAHELPNYREGFVRYLGFSFHQFFLVYCFVLGISYAFDYAGANRRRELRESELEREIARAELRALQMQLQPHFLFNTLHAIGALVRGGENKQAVSMIAGLSDLLRHALNAGGQQRVRLRDELDFVQRYLEIELVRFRDRLSVEWEVDDEALSALVPNLVLQPLVENAVRHGIGRKAGAGKILIRVVKQEHALLLEIQDDGAGFGHQAPGNGVGLKNTEARLERLYGASASLSIGTGAGGVGVTVILKIPLQFDRENS